MTRTDISFRTSDNVTLRGWFFTPSNPSSSNTTTTPTQKLPCLVLAHGFSCVKEMGLSEIASRFVSSLPLTCLVFDYRGFGSSDTLPGQPRQEAIPAQQIADIRDAITYAQMRDEVDKDRIGLWGSSWGGGLVLTATAADRRVKAVVSLAALTDGWENFLRIARADLIDGMNQAFEADRIARMSGQPPAMMPIVSEDPLGPCALPSRDSHQYFSSWATPEKGSVWKNEITLRSAEEIRNNNHSMSHLRNITPTPVLYSINTHDTNTPPDLAFRTYAQLCEPKELVILDGTHYEYLDGKNAEVLMQRTLAFLKRTLC